MPSTVRGLVSVILVNFRGTDDTIEAIRQLRALDWPTNRLEIVVLENGSGDDSAARLGELEGIRLIVSEENRGFAGGCNLAVAASSGEIIALLNNDAKPDPQWVAAAVAVFDEDPTIGAVASRVLDWEGELVDYIGSAMTWYGAGYKPLTGEPVPRVPDGAADVLFGTGSAMFVRRSAWDAVDGFDDLYFMFYEDVDLGWRLNLAGWRYRYVPESLAFHKHHASMSSFGSFKETYLLERNALFTLYKNAGERYLRDALPAAMGLAVRRAVTRGELDSESFDLRKGADDGATMSIDKGTVAGVYAIDQFVEALPWLREARAAVQAARVAPEGRIRQLFGNFDAPVLQEPSYLRGYEHLVETFDLLEAPGELKVLVVTGDPIGQKLAGPGIRAWHMAEAISALATVTLVSMSGVEPIDAPFAVVHVPPGHERAFGRLEQWADVIIFQGRAMNIFESLRRSDRVLIADIYDPMHLEQLEQGRELGEEQWDHQVWDATAVLNEQLARADFFLAASQRQKLFWLGQLAGLGRVNPSTYQDDPHLDRLVGVVPFGLSTTPPVHERQVLKGVWPGIGPEDRVLLWSGGLYNWFDPQTLIRAVALLAERELPVRLYFLGTKNPHPGVPEMGIVAESRALATELGVAGTHVFFNDSWVDFADRANYLLEADLGVSTHHAHIETTFSFRTRILDYLWAELPMVVTEGDHFAALVEQEGLGVVVPAMDPVALAAAIERTIFDDEFRASAIEQIQRVREDYTWPVVLRPLLDFIRDPQPAADRRDPAALERARRARLARRHGLRHDLRLAMMYLRTAGPRTVARKVLRRLRRQG